METLLRPYFQIGRKDRLTASSEAELMETAAWICLEKTIQLTASSEAELMETVFSKRSLNPNTEGLTASSEAELMETRGKLYENLLITPAHRFFGSGINGNSY